jgi:hypothetical protein
MKFFLAFILLAFTFVSCTYSKKEVDYPIVTTCDTANVKFSADFLPLLTSKCNTSGCHNSSDQAGGWILDTYNGVKDVIDNGNGRLLKSIQQDGTVSAMPKGGAKLSDCEINKIQAWINAGALNN